MIPPRRDKLGQFSSSSMAFSDVSCQNVTVVCQREPPWADWRSSRHRAIALFLVLAALLQCLPLAADQGHADSPLFTLDTRWDAGVGLADSPPFALDTRWETTLAVSDSALFILDTRQQSFIRVADSGFFTLDTLYQRGLAAANSRLFILDTRVSTSLASADSPDFTLDTRAASIPSAFFSGLVRSGQTPMPGAQVFGLLNRRVVATTTSDAAGRYNLGPVPPGVYELRAAFPDYLTAFRYGLEVLAGQTTVADLILTAKPPPPTVTLTTREPSESEMPQISRPGTTNLLVLWNDHFEPATNHPPVPSTMTVVLTHGCCANPITWVLAMARQLEESLPSQGRDPVNILAWDWSGDAGTFPGGLFSVDKVIANGLALGTNLYAYLGENYSRPLHFIGHSYGSLVNRYAVDYLHGDKGACQPSAPWCWSRTHLTLFDEGEAGSLLGQAVILGEGIRVVDTALISSEPQDALVAGAYVVGAAQELSVWRNPIPARFQWIDNYISAFGFRHSEALNVFLTKAGPETSFLAIAMHGYPTSWYQGTVESPARCIVGFTNSFEMSDVLPPSQDFAPGAVYAQIPLPFVDEYVVVRDDGITAFGDNLLRLGSVAAGLARQVVNIAAQEGGRLVVEGTGNFVSFIGEKFHIGINGAISAGRTTTGLIQTGAQRAGDAFVDFAEGVLSLRLFGGSGPQPPQPGNFVPASAGGPAAVWLRVSVPTNAHLMSFEVKFSGETGQDCLSFGINGTNLLTFEAKHFENEVPINTGLLDVSRFLGQEIELFFGLFNSASTNASVEVSSIRFFSVPPPALTIQQAGSAAVVSWPLYATGYELQSSESVGAGSSWQPVTNAPVGVVDFKNTVTNQLARNSRFFRLRLRE